jgi:hypothetical protein
MTIKEMEWFSAPLKRSSIEDGEHLMNYTPPSELPESWLDPSIYDPPDISLFKLFKHALRRNKHKKIRGVYAISGIIDMIYDYFDRYGKMPNEIYLCPKSVFDVHFFFSGHEYGYSNSYGQIFGIRYSSIRTPFDEIHVGDMVGIRCHNPEEIENRVVAEFYYSGEVQLAYAIGVDDRDRIIQHFVKDFKNDEIELFCQEKHCVAATKDDSKRTIINWDEFNGLNFWEEDKLIKFVESRLLSEPILFEELDGPLYPI